MVLTDVTLPVFFIVVIGFLLRRLGKLDERVFSRLQLYALSPALVFIATARAEAGTILILRVLLYVAILAAAILAVTQGIGFLTGRDRAERHAMSLSTVFMNSGFYGIPVCLLAFGEKGLIYATIFVVASSTVQSTLGVFLASAGSRKPSQALATVFKVPLIHSIVLARLLVHFKALPPEPLMKMINLLGQAAIPIGLILLGMQLERIISCSAAGGAGGRDEPSGRRDIAGGLLSAALRIVGGFAAALIIIRLFDFDPVLRNVIIVESSMPTAVNVVIYATEFNCRPRLVAMGILCSTLASILSITLILNYLG